MTDKRLFLKAGEGRIVRREEDGKLWPAEGDWAEPTLYVRRRIKDKDLVQATPPDVEAATAATEELPAPAEPQPPALEEAPQKPAKPVKPAADEKK